MEPTIVNGKKKADVLLFALSTCGWCRKTRTLLEELGVEYSYIYVDKLSGADRENVEANVRTWNPSCSFPTIVLNNTECIVGFQEDILRAKLG